MISRITSKGQVTIPKRIRDRLGVGYGDTIDFREEEHEIVVRKAGESFDVRDLRGILPASGHLSDDRIRAAKDKALRKKWAYK